MKKIGNFLFCWVFTFYQNLLNFHRFCTFFSFFLKCADFFSVPDAQMNPRGRVFGPPNENIFSAPLLLPGGLWAQRTSGRMFSRCPTWYIDIASHSGENFENRNSSADFHITKGTLFICQYSDELSKMHHTRNIIHEFYLIYHVASLCLHQVEPHWGGNWVIFERSLVFPWICDIIYSHHKNCYIFLSHTHRIRRLFS